MKIPPSKYYLERKCKWLSYFYGVAMVSIAFFAIFYIAANSFSWWILLVLPLLSTVFMFIFYQDLFIPVSKAAYPELEDMKKQRITGSYYKYRIRTLILNNAIFTLVVIVVTVFIIYRLQ